jgi:hypothetical protein
MSMPSLQVGLHGRLHIGILQFAGQGGAIERSCAMHLAKRSGSRRMVLEACEPCLPIRAKFCTHAPLDESPAHRRGFALQLLQLGCVLRWQQIGNGRHQLGDLHQRTFEIAKRRGERGGFAGAIALAANKTSPGIARRYAADIGADAGIACGAGGEAILFLVSHRLKSTYVAADTLAGWGAQ